MAKKKQYLVIVNFDIEVGIVFAKNFNEKNHLMLKKLRKGNPDEALSFAYDIASDVSNEMNYQIVVEQEETPVCFEAGYVTPDGDLIPQRSEEEEKLNSNPAPQGDEDVKSEVGELTEAIASGADRLDWWLEVTSPKDKEATLYSSDPETGKEKEYYDSSAIRKAKELVKAGICVVITVGRRDAKTSIDGFLKYKGGEFFIEVERKYRENKFVAAGL